MHQVNMQGEVSVSLEKGLEHFLLWDGFNERLQMHQDPKLSRKDVLKHFNESVSKLDEICARTNEVVGSMTTELIIPMELTHNAGEIPAATVSRLIPEVEAANELLSDAGKERMKMSSTPSIAKQQMDTAQHMLATSTESSLNRIRDSIRSVVAGAGLRKQARRMLEPGWHDLDAERAIIGAALGESALKVITTCQNSGLRSIDFKDKEHERLWEAAEKVKNNNLLQSDRQALSTLLRKELGEAKRQLINKLEQQGKKNAPCDLQNMIASVLLKARLRRAYEATTKGVGIRTEAESYDTSKPCASWAAGTKFGHGEGMESVAERLNGWGRGVTGAYTAGVGAQPNMGRSMY
ncbi:hypothetical protein GUITHDRAFT_165295 [Guillardia theta CCMP2712]|uniref:Uncharacterized protein n=1 Tax=Guillardia theta (strain CCMP2712) TaxID=905079 RepID=L1INY1_GUITC|nr:hypothetical protein GUITHDRAFT_165295 [Guillardia theta CCMP2712]EKX37996.1 hypothetical protein GUITHDRAFT_165295 [Guillardia theta CCMP2712]|eukprot:XP_005824976.1 hypothetical protein GUITHDRAFT_165295 [Guillardia theta CCMP2712]